MAVLAFPLQTASAPRRASLASYLPSQHERPLLRFTTAGSVDDGKSTLIGRLLHDAHSVYDDQLEDLRASRFNRSSGTLDLSLLTDGLKAEREQGITIDVAYRHFSTARRRFLIADTPGHEQYTRNMATGASTTEATVILVDARHGLTAQSRRHAYIAWQLGIRHLLIAVNKMDLVDFDAAVFESVRAAWQEFAAKLPDVCFHVIPVSALEGDNIFHRSTRMAWYDGPSLIELLEEIDAPSWDAAAPLRFGVQCVIRPDLEFRGYAGRIESGRIHAGDFVSVLPSGKRTRVERMVTFEGDLDEAFAPMAVTLVLADQLDVGRGDWICAADSAPAVAQRLEATIVWMHEQPLERGTVVLLQQGGMCVPGAVRKIVHRVDPETYERQPASQLALNEIGLVRLEAARALVFDPYRDNRRTGSFILIDRIGNHTLAAGMVERALASEPRPRQTPEMRSFPVTPAERFERYGHHPALVVSRSQALRRALERALFDAGAAVAILDVLPAPAQVRQLLANGLILLAPPGGGPSAIEAVETASIDDSVEATLLELERRGVLP